MNDKQNRPASFSTTVDLKLAKKLTQDLSAQGFEISKPQYTVFSAKNKGLTCTLYESGKLLVQGKETPTFLEFYLEPEILGKFSYTYSDLEVDTSPHIGIDEAGKGDFFGPLCIAGVYASGDEILKLKEIGVKDSKSMTDKTILILADKIKARCQHHIVKINPFKYNELYGKFKNLNKLLAWGHATAIEALLQKTGCKEILIDQFAAESVVKTALSRKGLEVNLTQRHRGEEDLVVAAASILARQAFVQGIEALGREYSMVLPKGASQDTIKAGCKLLAQHGMQALGKAGKLHFKTLDAILAKTPQYKP